MVKYFGCNDIEMVGGVTSWNGVLVVPLGRWPPAVDATVPPIGQFVVRKH